VPRARGRDALRELLRVARRLLEKRAPERGGAAERGCGEGEDDYGFEERAGESHVFPCGLIARTRARTQRPNE